MSQPASTFTDITAVILAGGASQRMRQPKALLPWREQRFIDHIIAALRPQVAHIAISSSQPELFAGLNLPVLADPFAERRGPLAGMLAGMRFASTPLTLFVPCDSPLIAPSLAARLRAALVDQRVDVAYARSGDDLHYLYALMRSDLQGALANHLAAGDYAVRRWFATVAHTAVSFDDAADCFLNLNTHP
jgi:molybdenum cofactor guanylyltransferase